MTVLICDSLVDNRRLIRQLLERNPGWRIVEADSPRQVLEALEEQDVSLVVTDVQVASVDGESFLAVLRRDHPQLPCVVISPRGPDAAVVQALMLGAAGYVPRSSMARDLVGTVERLLRMCGAQSTLAPLMPHLGQATCTFLLPNDREMIPAMAAYVRGDLQRLGFCGPAERMRFGTAVAEAVTNAMVHGNLGIGSELKEEDMAAYNQLIDQRRLEQPYADRRVTVEVVFDPQSARVVVRDQGAGFDTSSIPDPTDPDNLLKCTGRGLLLMKAFTDELHFNDQGNEATLVVYRATS